MTVGSNGLRASSTVNGTPLRTLGTFATGADRGRSARRAPRDRACEQRRTKADSQTRRGGESAYGAYSASEDGQETVLLKVRPKVRPPLTEFGVARFAQGRPPAAAGQGRT